MRVIVKNNFKEYLPTDPRNQKSISASIRSKAKDSIEADLKQIFETVVSKSPVDTGAFITSWSLVPKGSGAGRMRSSKGKPRNQDKAEKMSVSLSQLHQDLESIPNLLDGVVLRNRAPHAPEVERKYGTLLGLGDSRR